MVSTPLLVVVVVVVVAFMVSSPVSASVCPSHDVYHTRRRGMSSGAPPHAPKNSGPLAASRWCSWPYVLVVWSNPHSLTRRHMEGRSYQPSPLVASPYAATT